MPDDDLAAREWLARWLDRNHIKYDSLTQAQKFLLMREIPCSIRCWRVGGPVDVKPGEKCSECGHEEPKPTAWERIPLPV
jgi:hypothetical protein